MIVFEQGKPLFVNGRLAMSIDCCCNPPCYKYCFYVHGAVSGYANEPGVSPPLTHPFSSRNARIVYHGHNVDTVLEPHGSQYHAHLWVIEFCITPTNNKLPGDIAIEYAGQLESWATGALSIAWTGSSGQTGGGDQAGVLTCSLDAVNTKKSELLTAPVANTTTDLLGPLDFDGCVTCE